MLEQIIKNKLISALPGAIIEVKNTSIEHWNHNTSGAHIFLSIEFPDFIEMTLIERHRKIHEILKEELKEKIHALKIHIIL
jgi:BolA family transcriptional regulator, general stress-responsive regulator